MNKTQKQMIECSEKLLNDICNNNEITKWEYKISKHTLKRKEQKGKMEEKGQTFIWKQSMTK